MSGKKRLIFLLLVITTWMQQSGSGSKQSSNYPTVKDSLCIPQTVERTRAITVQHTQTVYIPTTLSICPTPSLTLRKDNHPMIPNIVYITRCPACTSSTVTSTSCPQVLSDTLEIGIVVISGVLICMAILALVIVSYCWAKTRLILKEKRNSDHSTHYSIPTSDVNIRATATLKLNNNPAYGTQTVLPLQENVEYENTTVTTRKPEEPRVLTDSVEPYEIVSLISSQSAGATTEMHSSREELNRDTVQQM